MHTFLKYFEIVLSILLIFSIMLQNKTTGMSSGSMTATNSVQTTKRGAEKLLFNATIVFAVLYVSCAIAFIFVG